jgi:hypothetical protein
LGALGPNELNGAFYCLHSDWRSHARPYSSYSVRYLREGILAGEEPQGVDRLCCRPIPTSNQQELSRQVAITMMAILPKEIKTNGHCSTCGTPCSPFSGFLVCLPVCSFGVNDGACGWSAAAREKGARMTKLLPIDFGIFGAASVSSLAGSPRRRGGPKVC